MSTTKLYLPLMNEEMVAALAQVTSLTFLEVEGMPIQGDEDVGVIVTRRRKTEETYETPSASQ